LVNCEKNKIIWYEEARISSFFIPYYELKFIGSYSLFVIYDARCNIAIQKKHTEVPHDKK